MKPMELSCYMDQTIIPGLSTSTTVIESDCLPGGMNRPNRKRSYGFSSDDESSTSDLSPQQADDDSLQRSGKWSGEEETFANQLVIDFETGALTDCEDGCTLRSYLARKLNCAPMRISKKFAGRCIGKVTGSASQNDMVSLQSENRMI